jgi:hypothetical protein
MDGSPDLEMLRIRAQQEMEPGERLRWVGRPHPWALARERLAALTVTPVLLGLGTFVIHVGASQPLPVDQAMLTMVIYGFGGLALLLGLVVFSGPVLAFLLARRTVYAISDRRLLTISGERVNAYGPGDIRAIMVTNERADGSADIVFGQDIRRYWIRGARFAEVNRLGFFGIPDPDHVRELIRDLRAEPTD